MAETYDVIIIGAGHNGLVAAAYLAKAGLKVLVLEQRPVVGGAAASEFLFAGHKLNTGAHDAGLFRPEIVQALALTDHDALYGAVRFAQAARQAGGFEMNSPLKSRKIRTKPRVGWIINSFYLLYPLFFLV